MHIAFLNPQGNFNANESGRVDHPDFGEHLVYVREVAIALARLGHKIDIITRQIIDRKWPQFSAPIERFPGIKNVNILRIPCGPKKFLTKEKLWPYLGTDWVNNILNFYASAGIRPDVFSAHHGTGGLAGALLSQKTGQPFTFSGHILGAQKMDQLQVTPENIVALDQKHHFARRILAERISMSHASRVIITTRQERRERYGHRVYQGAIDPEHKARFAVIHPGVNRRIFSPDPSEIDVDMARRIKKARKRDIRKGRRKLPLILATNGLELNKNHISTVQAFADTQNLRQHANLAIAVRNLEDPLHKYFGLDSSERVVLEEMIRIIEEHDLWDCATAFSINNPAELAAAYRVLAKRRAVFAAISADEPFSMAPLEAMSSGLPVVAAQKGELAKILQEGDQQFGILVDPADPRDIGRGLLKLVESKKVWKQFHKAGIQRVASKYTWQQTAAGYLGVFAEIRETGSPPNPVEIHPWFTNPTQENEISLETLAGYYS